ncbi:MAG TPA: type II toxin-antitoxin system ParD family antitoxin [Beijerinckiaceae bacterium]|jgi:antitoxin ParD1/3/4
MASSVDLGPQLEAYIASLVEKGRYNSKSEVLREGVRLVQEREAKLAELDAAIARGVADAEAGRVHTVEEVRASLRERFGARAKRKRA